MDFEAARVKMVENQIRTTDVTSHSVLNAFLTVPRENFVPEKSKLLAYIDNDIEIAAASAGKPARFLMEASPLAKLLQLGVITKQDKVLDVGCGTGYVAAILSLLAEKVVALESDEELAAQAKANIAALGYDNVTVVTGDLEKGYAGNAPYDVIFIDGSIEQLPQGLLDQLGEDGRLITVIGYGHAARATVFMRERGAFSENVFFNASIKPLPGFAKAKEFVF
ncbi:MULTISPECIES: protein-L-isoaspartate O-methyltransferase [unclassified Rhizobium]|jgi:protein-L-isoaspartate(D-aspartate) O-methyltransferase|uniref:protein-L-isoaspartate O-methyltransferase family protein n=1 Tax=unclassified Rhizobium TaxID=2613769 RepID=UPI000DDF8BC3|nr:MULTISPECIES: protein-L-isoaspartate O-methyltransferase [unclassified Rhizobium]MBB3288964.1 protein-L-isoaspartate(D-aspartate) O-methyltransferase [Rhizobium sp. BK252]MBB3403706.1 protein-L-isoaspartate(D-aspartate) O-methyltransferase [Rhizobium sp. BK289]MBB3416108.1 protein-L-isoaspartate(D-aspartate) O-methyltransferase [Rhizobium sp. BK284]MBB3484170.1 protein-L-isoaspartate(D-aspartate) O-methyltransferase [Rhizobium sp. BK347]MDK4720167.1 protein-L-isoaspartate O-methyltransferas